MAKGLGSGLPISGIAASRELMERWKPGSHGGTYGGGSTIAAAAALATIQALQDEKLVENSARMGDYLMKRLYGLKKKHPVIGDVRGLGLMVATEFGKSRHPDKATTKAVQAACLERSLLLLTCGTYENVMRWIPPLIVTQDQIDEALNIFAEALEEAA
jgi:4-aminobutyrate aminotransferase-like enzyme